MADIKTSDLHRTPGGKSGFFRQLQLATQCARQQIAELRGSRKLDMSASGAIHALAMLADEATQRSMPVTEMEVDHWQETFFTWFRSVARYFPEALREEFREKAETDFAAIREKADTFSSTPWEQLKERYERPITFRDRETFDRACEAAKEKFPVDLGIALDKYLQACVQRLLSDQDADAPLAVKVKAERPEDAPGTVAPRFIAFEDGTYSLIVTSFGGLQRPAKSGTGLQNAVRKQIRKRDKQLLDALEFDSESSMFCVRSSCLQTLGVVSEVIFTIAANAKEATAS
ncbi:hypothetical protein AB1K70_21930 [Bremerella sp. JC770]|uniref:hypothetical protein n=1 Tax=Bremerella sp. JC770 TaxID=3232137 RepID=UPI0034596376